MTRDEILAMQPGNELDAHVAKYVMFPGTCSPLEEVKEWCQKYSTSISAAWEIAKKIEPNYWVRMNVMLGDHYCGIGRPDLLWECRAKSMPEAICKAALLAAMEVPNET